jgi:hypothetical protein
MTDWTIKEQKRFHPLHADQLYTLPPPPPPTSYPMGIRESLVDKQPGSEAEYLSPSSAKVKILWSRTSVPLYVLTL